MFDQTDFIFWVFDETNYRPSRFSTKKSVPVDDEAIFLHEAFPTFGTFVPSPVWIVNLFVRVQVSFLGEAFSALVAFKGAVICVFSHVILEVFPVFRSIIANFAFVLSVDIVCQIVGQLFNRFVDFFPLPSL